MTADLTTRVGTLTLKNPLIAAAAEHMIDEAGVRRAIAAGAGAVVVKSINEREAGKDQLQRAEYTVLDEQWRPVTWGPSAPMSATIATRSGLSPQNFDAWLEQTARLDREAAKCDSYAVATLILSDLNEACRMARLIEQAGLRVLEFNIGTPYASVTTKGNVTTEFDPSRVTEMVSAMRKAIKLPLWIKLTGQSERVPDLARAAFDAGADSVVMAGRLLGFIPDVDTLSPMLGTSLGIGGFWNLPLTCHWLAATRQALGKDKSLVGINGAQSGLDIARMMLSGASAVAMASAVQLRGFELLEDSLKEFSAYLARQNLRATDLIGRAADQRKSFGDMPLRTDNWRNYVPKV
jgi:dihydroorotate dehydrogenase